MLGGLFLTTWGGIKRPARAIILAWLFSSLFGMTLLGVGQTLVIWLVAVVVDAIFDPIVNVSMDSFLQAKVPPDLQGRVFSASDFISQAMLPITPLLAGYFGDRIFEPAMGTGGALANLFGWLVGTGPGSGFGLLIFLCGIGGYPDWTCRLSDPIPTQHRSTVARLSGPASDRYAQTNTRGEDKETYSQDQKEDLQGGPNTYHSTEEANRQTFLNQKTTQMDGVAFLVWRSVVV